VLFSEPKIPQCASASAGGRGAQGFQCSSASRKFLNLGGLAGTSWYETCFSALQRAENSSINRVAVAEYTRPGFQCSSASRKFLNYRRRAGLSDYVRVSVLFSEPKIPQSRRSRGLRAASTSFSALQRAENSSIAGLDTRTALRLAFQCSSASRKFLNRGDGRIRGSMTSVSVLFSEPKIPQSTVWMFAQRPTDGFSALQRAENSSIDLENEFFTRETDFVSVLFSEPKIPQSQPPSARLSNSLVSVLFSEPKIPQYTRVSLRPARNRLVSVLFSEPKIPQSTTTPRATRCFRPFQCSSASRKFLNRIWCGAPKAGEVRFSALQRAENSSIVLSYADRYNFDIRFSALQRAENSSIVAYLQEMDPCRVVSVLFSEPKIPQ